MHEDRRAQPGFISSESMGILSQIQFLFPESQIVLDSKKTLKIQQYYIETPNHRVYIQNKISEDPNTFTPLELEVRVPRIEVQSFVKGSKACLPQLTSPQFSCFIM